MGRRIYGVSQNRNWRAEGKKFWNKRNETYQVTGRGANESSTPQSIRTTGFAKCPYCFLISAEPQPGKLDA